MKTNRDQLNNAFHHLRDDTLTEAMTVMNAPAVSKTARTRRFLTATAACLTAVLALGAVLALPMLKTDDPAVPPATLPATDSAPSAGELSYYDAPIVRLDMLSATETATISDPAIPTESLSTNFMQTDYFTNLHVLLFDCLPGETVTLRANRECLGYVGMPYDPNIFYTKGDLEEWEKVQDEWQNYMDLTNNLHHRSEFDNRKAPEKASKYSATDESYTFYERELTIDPFSSSVILGFDYSAPEDAVEEDVILYTVTNEEGQITGAGAIYVGKKYVMDHSSGMSKSGMTQHAMTIARAAVLGSVRFTDPAAVTEEQVNALLATYAEEGKNGQSLVDFTPVTYEEINAVAGNEIVQSIFKDADTSGGGRSIFYYTDYSFYHVTMSETDETREFIIFKDGTWAELDREHGEYQSSNGHINAECPHTEEYGYHGIGPGCIVKTTDGRFYLLEGYDSENIERTYTAVLIENPAT